MDSQKVEAAAAERPETMVSTRLGSLRVTSVGSGPPTVLWHSLFVDSMSWDRLIPLIADRRLLIIDGPSHGRSEPASRLFTLQECAGAASDVLDLFDVQGPVDWVGNAWGGHVGMVFAAAHPARFRSLITIGTPVNALGAAERLRLTALVALYRLIGPADPLVKMVCDALLGRGMASKDPEAYATVADALRYADRKGMYRAMRSAMLRRPDLTAKLPQLTMPTLLIAASDDPLWTPVAAAEAARLLPRGHSAAVSGGGHLPVLLSAPAVADLVTSFWQQAGLLTPG